MSEFKVIKRESAREACIAVAAIVAKDTQLARIIDQTTVAWPDNQRMSVFSCPKCSTGLLHCVGRNRIVDGRLGMGGLLICDSCGHYERR